MIFIYRESGLLLWYILQLPWMGLQQIWDCSKWDYSKCKMETFLWRNLPWKSPANWVSVSGNISLKFLHYLYFNHMPPIMPLIEVCKPEITLHFWRSHIILGMAETLVNKAVPLNAQGRDLGKKSAARSKKEIWGQTVFMGDKLRGWDYPGKLWVTKYLLRVYHS